MNRLQIIIFSFIAVFLAIILTGQEEKDFKSDYDLWFVCSLNTDFSNSRINTKLGNDKNEESLKTAIKNSANSNNSSFETFLNQSYFALKNTDLLSSTCKEQNIFKSYLQSFLLSPRSPPHLAFI